MERLAETGREERRRSETEHRGAGLAKKAVEEQIGPTTN